MTYEQEQLVKLAEQYKPCEWADTLLRQAVVVTREGLEIQFFNDERDAGAWMQHVYGVTPLDGKKEGIIVKPIRDRGPKAGDLLIYLDDGEWYTHGIGILDHSYGKDELSVCFAARCFRVWDHVDCSGGPIPPVDPADLVFDGLRENYFWRWWDGCGGCGGADKAGSYSINTPSWRWNGKRV